MLAPWCVTRASSRGTYHGTAPRAFTASPVSGRDIWPETVAMALRIQCVTLVIGRDISPGTAGPETGRLVARGAEVGGVGGVAVVVEVEVVEVAEDRRPRGQTRVSRGYRWMRPDPAGVRPGFMPFRSRMPRRPILPSQVLFL